MYLMYIDESGDTIPISQGGKNFLVLTGCIIHENEKVSIETQFREIKQKYYQNPDIEIKSNFLRYANPDLSENSPIKLNDRKKYDELEKDMADFLKNIPVVLYTVIIHKAGYWQKCPNIIERVLFSTSERTVGIPYFILLNIIKQKTNIGDLEM